MEISLTVRENNRKIRWTWKFELTFKKDVSLKLKLDFLR